MSKFLFEDRYGMSVTVICDSWETAEAVAEREGWELLGQYVETIYEDAE